jgi:carbohydrate-selective porin OprB
VLQPDVQYVLDPDTDPAIDDALVVMLRIEALF